ncbi:conserved protein, unknown function [Plasmodium ovale curtisi]|uniref:GAF domain-containing protein n=1 Tax=Plasmodium ovale curtisi TaxID=864141 RepID=A0A1A8VU67_PLAOA|nr:conserved protein, unknown function [Plasmodium ovale curtisi]
MYVRHISLRLTSNTFFKQQQKKMATSMCSDINYFTKTSLSYYSKMCKHNEFHPFNNFPDLKKNKKNMNSHNHCTDRKNTFLKKCFFQISNKCHLQSDIITRTIRKKQNICLIKRKKKKVHSNYFKYGINTVKLKMNSIYLFNLRTILQGSILDLINLMKHRQYEFTSKRLCRNIHHCSSLQSLVGIHRKTFHTDVKTQQADIIRRKGGACKKGKIAKRGEIEESVNGQRQLTDLRGRQRQGNRMQRGKEELSHNCSTHHNLFHRSDGHEEKQKDGHQRGNHFGNNEERIEDVSRNNVEEKSRDNMNVSYSTSQTHTGKKKVEYTSKDFDKQIEEKIHEKGEMNIKRHDLILVALSGCIPFICFGFVDNSFMIISGDLFDSTFCVFLGFSTMAAAGLGNLTSDVLGIFIGGYIEKIIVYIGFPRINLTNKQLKMNRTRRYYYAGSAFGIAIGCLLGMIPLLFIDSTKLEEKKNRHKKKKKNNITDHINKKVFQMVSTQLPDYINSNYAFLFVFNKDKQKLYSFVDEEMVNISFDEGFIGEAFKNKKVINYERSTLIKKFSHFYDNATHEQEEKQICEKEIHQGDDHAVEMVQNADLFFRKRGINIHQVMVAPVLGTDESVVGVVVAINAKNKTTFNEKDAQFLSMFCAHISQEIEDRRSLVETLR